MGRRLLPIIIICLCIGIGLDALAQNEESVFGQLEAIEARFAEGQAKISKLKKQRKQLDNQISDAKKAVVKAEKGAGDQKRLLKKRLREAYKVQSGSNWEYLLASKDFSDFVLRRHYVQRLWQADAEKISGFNKQIDTISREKQAITDKRSELDALLKKLANAQNELKEDLAQRKAFVEKVQKDEALQKRAAAEMAEASQGLSRKVASIKPRTEAPFAAFSMKKGNLSCPVSGRISIGFGEASRRNAKRFHGGYDIKAKLGSPIKAPAAAKVVYAGRLRGFGNLIILDHGEKYYTLYAHLQSLGRAVGQNIKPGEVIGQVGETGSLQGPLLYFELRKGGKAINPDDWFRCR